MIRYFIELSEIKNFVETAVELCYDEDGVYRPYLKEFAINYTILKYYSDFSLEDYKISEVYSKVYSEWCDEIKNIRELSSQIPHLIAAIEYEIHIRTEKHIRETKLSVFINKIIDILNDSIENPETLNVIMETLNTIKGDNDGKESENQY